VSYRLIAVDIIINQ